MSDNPKKSLTRQEFMAFLSNLPPEHQRTLVTAVRTMATKVQEKRCEDYFDQLDVMLPSHDSSRLETHRLITSLRSASRPSEGQA